MNSPPLSLLILSLLLVFSLSPTVESETHTSSSVLRLPSDNGGGADVCPNQVGPGSCPVKCFRTDPVCGEDGVTYWCGCAEAHCAGTRVAKLGFCDVGNGGSSGQVLLLLHLVWLVVLGFSVLCGFL